LWVLIASGFIVLFTAVKPSRRLAAIAPFFMFSLATTPLWLTIFIFFAKASLVVFGSGLAVLPFLYGGVVEQYHWLTDRQFLDAVAVSMITPGPVVITVAFIGYLVDGLTGATAAALGMFLPVYLVVIVVAPFYHKVRDNRGVQAFVIGVTAGHRRAGRRCDRPGRAGHRGLDHAVHLHRGICCTANEMEDPGSGADPRRGPDRNPAAIA
jgi:chromate transporter